MATTERKSRNGILPAAVQWVGRVSPLRAAYQAPGDGEHGVTHPILSSRVEV